MRSTSVNSFFQTNDEKFKKACKRIEQDDNFLADEEHNNSTNNKRIFITSSKINAQLFGKIYQITMMEQIKISEKLVILVSVDGNYSIHKKTYAEQKNFNHPLKNYQISDFLNPLTYWREIFTSDPDESLDKQEYASLKKPLKNISFTSSNSNNPLTISHSESDEYFSHEENNATSDPGHSPNLTKSRNTNA